MKSDWKKVTVQELVDNDILAKPKDGNHGSIHPKSEDYVDSGIPFVMSNNLNHSKVDFNSCKFITEDTANNLRKGFAEPGDVLLSHKGTIGRTSILQDHNYPTVVLTPQVTYYRVLDSSVLNSRYLRYYFDSKQFQDILWAWASDGSTRAYLGITDQRKLPIILPPIETQENISKTLGDFDDKVEVNKRIADTLEDITRTIFKSWFLDFDPVRAKIRANQNGNDPEKAAMAAISGISLDQDWENLEESLAQKISHMSGGHLQGLRQAAAIFPDKMEDSELGEIPRGWITKPLDEVADFLNGRAMQKYPPEEGKDTLRVLKISQLRKGDTVDADIASADIPERFKVHNGDMIFSWSGSLLIDLWCGGDAALNQHLFKVTSENYEKWFYYLWTKHHLDNFIRIAEAKAVTMGHIKRSHLKEAKCVIPPEDLLNLGNRIIQPLLDKAIQLKLESKNLEELRDTLLPKLISGEIETDKVVSNA